MAERFLRFTYTGTALPTGSTTVTLLDTTTFPYPNFFQKHGIHRVLVDLTNDQTGTLKVYQSADRGTTWVQIVPTTTVAANATNATNQYDYLVEPYPDWKLTWTNGGVTQTTFTVNVMGIDSRNPAA